MDPGQARIARLAVRLPGRTHLSRRAVFGDPFPDQQLEHCEVLGEKRHRAEIGLAVTGFGHVEIRQVRQRALFAGPPVDERLGLIAPTAQHPVWFQFRAPFGHGRYPSTFPYPP